MDARKGAAGDHHGGRQLRGEAACWRAAIVKRQEVLGILCRGCSVSTLIGDTDLGMQQRLQCKAFGAAVCTVFGDWLGSDWIGLDRMGLD